MPSKSVDPAVFTRLRDILRSVSPKYDVQHDTPDNFYLNVKSLMHKKKPVFFAAVQRKKNYVSFHLMPLYMNPVLQARVTADLKKRMQGKACFNFTEVDEKLFAQLADLVKTGDAGYLKCLEAAGVNVQLAKV